MPMNFVKLPNALVNQVLLERHGWVSSDNALWQSFAKQFWSAVHCKCLIGKWHLFLNLFRFISQIYEIQAQSQNHLKSNFVIARKISSAMTASEAGLEVGHLKIAHAIGCCIRVWNQQVLRGYKVAQRHVERSSKRALLSRSVTHLMRIHKYLVSTCVEKFVLILFCIVPSRQK